MGRVVFVGTMLFAIVGCGSLDRGLPTWSSNFVQSVKGKSKDRDVDGAQSSSDPRTVDIPLARPTQQNPVTLGAAVSRTRVYPGEQVVLVVRCQTAPPWHIYAAEGSADTGVPTQLKLTLPPGMIQPSPIQLPPADTSNSPLGEIHTYSGDFRFLLPLQVAEGATAGEVKLQCEVAYQACSDSTCLSPDSQRLVIPLFVQSPK